MLVFCTKKTMLDGAQFILCVVGAVEIFLSEL